MQGLYGAMHMAGQTTYHELMMARGEAYAGEAKLAGGGAGGRVDANVDLV